MSEIIKEEHDGRIARFVIDNPTARNGLTPEAAARLGARIRAVGSDPSVRAIVIRGAGAHFCSGADLKAAAGVVQSSAAEKRAHVRERFHAAIEAIAEVPQPVLAVVRGACVGFGFDLAMACDLRLAATNAKFAQVFTRIGLVPDGGSSFSLPRLVGYARAMELALLAEDLHGARAEALGLVNRAVDEAELEALAADWTERLASGPPIAFRLAKQNLRLGAAGGTLAEALDREADAQVACLESGDAMRGVAAFFQKVKPAFEGN